jgi:hypothetical protein
MRMAAANRCRGRHEGRHDAVSCMFDLATLSSRQSVPDNRVMDVKQGHTCLVSPGFIRRADDIGEKNSPDCRIAAAGRPTAQHHRSGVARFTFAEKGLYKLGLDLDESFRDLAVGVTMHYLRRLRTRRIDEAETLAPALVEPVLEILDAVLPLLREVGGVVLLNLYRGCSQKAVQYAATLWRAENLNSPHTAPSAMMNVPFITPSR